LPDLITGFALAAVVLIIASLVSGFVERAPLSFPIIFLGLGFLIGERGFGLLTLKPEDHTLEAIAILTLALVLFLDAVRMEAEELRGAGLAPILSLGPGTLIIISVAALGANLLLAAPANAEMRCPGPICTVVFQFRASEAQLGQPISVSIGRWLPDVCIAAQKAFSFHISLLCALLPEEEPMRTIINTIANLTTSGISRNQVRTVKAGVDVLRASSHLQRLHAAGKRSDRAKMSGNPAGRAGTSRTPLEDIRTYARGFQRPRL
jgi:hypothetical protein